MARLATTADVFNAIAEPRRRAILDLLSDGRPWAVGDVVARLPLAQPSVSKHLGVLRAVGLVSVARAGQHRLYRLEAAPLAAVRDWLRTYDRYCAHQLGRIKARAEQAAGAPTADRPTSPNLTR